MFPVEEVFEHLTGLHGFHLVLAAALLFAVCFALAYAIGRVGLNKRKERLRS